MLRQTLPALALMMVASAVQATTGTLFRDLDPDTADLSAHQWADRPVVIFAPSPEDPKLKQALAALRLAEPGLDDRDVVVLTDTNPGAEGALRGQIKPEGFTMLLIGKDGGIKLQSQDVLSPDQLFAAIDRMPMRQRELQQN